MKLSDKNYAEIIARAANHGSDSKEIARALWQELSNAKKIKDLDRIFEIAENITAAQENRLIAKVASAIPLTPEQQDEINLYLTQKLNKEIISKYSVNQDLGAGIVVDVDGNIYDITLRDKIQRLKKLINK